MGDFFLTTNMKLPLNSWVFQSIFKLFLTDVKAKNMDNFLSEFKANSFCNVYFLRKNP